MNYITELKSMISTDNISLIDAMKMIDNNSIGILFIVDGENRLIGCASDGDIRRYIISSQNLNVTIAECMNRHPLVLDESTKDFADSIMQKNGIRCLPFVDDTNRITMVVTKDYHKTVKNDKLKNVPVVIMAGGKGSRLEPYTLVIPKPLIPIGGKPIIERIMEKYALYGATDYYISVNYKKNMLKAYFKDNDDDFERNITFIEENKPLGTAGSLSLMEFDHASTFFVTNCDVLIKSNYSEMYKYHKENDCCMTVVSSLKEYDIPYGVIKTEDGMLESIQEKPKLTFMISTGMYIMEKECIDFIEKNQYLEMPDLIRCLKENGKKVGVYPIVENSFYDMGEYKELERMEAMIAAEELC